MNSLQAKTDLGPVNKGGSGSHFVRCDDNNVYVVKFADNSKTAINEYVGGSLAKMLNLPTPTMALINLSQELIDLSSQMSSRNVKPGYHIGSQKLPDNIMDFDKIDNDALTNFTLLNSDDLYGIICFDNWVLNTDRHNGGNNMIEVLPGQKLRFHIIDFGHCFVDNNWTGLNNRIQEMNLMNYLPYFQRYLNKIESFEVWCKIIIKIDDSTIINLISSIPSSWMISKEESEQLVKFIQTRKELVLTIINNNRNQLGV